MSDSGSAEMASPEKELKCRLRKCIQCPLASSMARVEVMSFDTPTTDCGHMEVDWGEDGEAMFHDICWKAMIDSVKIDNPFTLCPLEKDMMLEAKKTAEYFDSHEKVRLEARRIAQVLRAAKYAIVFTGAGISTSAGIGDFRGKAGKWTERDREKTYGVRRSKQSRDVVFEKLRPTYTHEAIYKLMELGYIKHVISQNTDGLHRLSGVARDKISELHGNSYHERCEKCGARYERPYAVRRSRGGKVTPRICVHCHFDHRTGRMCERKGCDGFLMNTIINFGDSLEKKVLSAAEEHAKRNDLVICLGTSLRVTPACDIVEMGEEPPRVVLCNRQPTPFDKLCYIITGEKRDHMGSRVFGDCDQLMTELMTCMLTSDQLQDWEADRDNRMEQYARARQIVD